MCTRRSPVSGKPINVNASTPHVIVGSSLNRLLVLYVRSCRQTVKPTPARRANSPMGAPASITQYKTVGCKQAKTAGCHRLRSSAPSFTLFRSWPRGQKSTAYPAPACCAELGMPDGWALGAFMYTVYALCMGHRREPVGKAQQVASLSGLDADDDGIFQSIPEFGIKATYVRSVRSVEVSVQPGLAGWGSPSVHTVASSVGRQDSGYEVIAPSVVQQNICAVTAVPPPPPPLSVSSRHEAWSRLNPLPILLCPSCVFRR